MSANCKSCGKLMTRPEDFSGGDPNSQYCSNCTNADGSLKSLDEIILNIANQLIMSQGIDREAATKAARSILSVQPGWRNSFKKAESKRTLKNRILIVATCVVLVTTTIVVYNIFAPNPNRIYTWDNNKDTAVFIASTAEKQDFGDIQVLRMILYGDQDVMNVDSSGIVEFIQNHSVFRGRAKDNRSYSIMIDNHASEHGSSYVGSINTSGNLYISETGSNFDFKGMSIFWAEDNDGNRVLHINSDSHGGRIGYLKSIYDVAFCGYYAVWIEENGNPQLSKVMAYNAKTGKVFQVSYTGTWKSLIKAGGTCVYWLDSGDQTKTGSTIVGFDFASMSPITTGIRIGTMKYQDNFGLGTPGTLAKQGRQASWAVVGNDVLYENVNDKGKLYIFDKDAGTVKTFSDSKHLPFFVKTVWLNNETDKYEVFVDPDESFYADIDPNSENPYVCWVSGIENGKYGLSFKKMKDSTSKSLSGLEISMPLGVTGQWFVYLQDDKKDAEKTGIFALNLSDGKVINLGSYSFMGVMPDQYYVPHYALFNKYLAWSAKTEDAGYDIFYTKLP